jgi:hypothetical protein
MARPDLVEKRHPSLGMWINKLEISTALLHSG